MRFYEQFVRYRDEALQARRQGDLRAAREKLLRAAECLFRLAQYSTGALRETRVKSARHMVELARQIPDQPPAGQPDAQQESPGAAADASTQRWQMSAKPGIRFDDIAGLHDVKEAIRRKVLYPFLHPEATARYRKRPGGGVLLYGPPGTGKTMLAKAIATELDAAFFCVKCSDIMSKWVGEAERNLRDLFAAARAHKAAVIFLDETEALVSRRGGDSTVMNRLIPEFLAQVDGVDTNASSILLLGATNRPWDMDEAALRHGRFGEHIFIGLPDAEARRQILSMNLEGVPVEPQVTLDDLAARTEGLSGADLVGFVARATDRPYSREVSSGTPDMLTCADVDAALLDTKPSITEQQFARYTRFQNRR